MKRLLFALCLLGASSTRAQIPVIDAAGLAQAAATLAEMQEQVRLLMAELDLARDIRAHTRSHLDRYRRALLKRGVVESAPLDRLVREVEAELRHGLSYARPGEMPQVFVGYARPDDPLSYGRHVTQRSMGTMEATVRALAAHRGQLLRSHRELEQFKREIASNPEPQQMRDVQASLQVLGAREALLTRQAIMTLTNMEAVRAAGDLNRRAQEHTLYYSFVGGSDWLGDPTAYRIEKFLRMPGG